MKKLLFLVIIVLCECTDSPSKQQGNKIDNSITPLFSFHCSDYGDPKFDTKIYINDSLLIIKHYGVAHSEKTRNNNKIVNSIESGNYKKTV